MGDTKIHAEPLPEGRKVVSLTGLELPPGETRLTLRVSGPTTDPDDFTSGQVYFKVESPRVTLLP